MNDLERFQQVLAEAVAIVTSARSPSATRTYIRPPAGKKPGSAVCVRIAGMKCSQKTRTNNDPIPIPTMNLYHVQSDETWKSASRECRSGFIEAMRDWDMDAGSTRDAWYWWRLGFMEGQKCPVPA